MRVAAGSRIRNLMGFAMKQIKDPAIQQITWNGSGHGISKTLTCAEIMKRKVKGLHQITKVRFKRIEEHWEPQKEDLERLKVNRDVPAITILLSKKPLDTNILGYQPPGSFDAFWKKLSTPAGNTSGRRRNNDAASTVDSYVYGSLSKKKKKRGAGKEPTASQDKANSERNKTKQHKQKAEPEPAEIKETDTNKDSHEPTNEASDAMAVDP